jgi:CRISPR-associated protein Cas2
LFKSLSAEIFDIGVVFFEEGLHMYLVVSYDIHDDKRRNRIHKVLKNFGERIQFSVFECDLTKEQILRMQHALEKVIKEEDQDSVRFYHLCDSCQRKIDRIGGIIHRDGGPVVL